MGDRTHLVIGASGQVGHALMRGLAHVGNRVVGTYFSREEAGLYPLDMRDGEAVRQIIEELRPDAVWIPGALPDVDRCEREEALSLAINVEGPARVLDAVSSYHIPLIYFSTDYVFDGVDGPFQESDLPHPLQVYGKHKVQAERELLQYPESLIIRPAWIYSDEPNPRNFLYRVLRDLQDGRPIKSAADQINTPTPAGPLAQHARRALHAGMRGILHLVGPDRMTRLDLVRSIAHQAGYDTTGIESIQVSDLPLAAKRPLNGGLKSEYPEFAIHERLQDLDFSSLLTQI